MVLSLLLAGACCVCQAARLLKIASGTDETTLSSGDGQPQMVLVVAGGGIGGAALAVALRHNTNIRVHVYEGDRGFAARRQGYGLTLQQGNQALRPLGLFDVVVAEDTITRSHYVMTPSGEIVGCFGRAFAALYGGNPVEKGKRHNVHIPRQRLRELLLQQLPPDTIQWGRRVTGFTERADGVQVYLDDGSQVLADLLVGADGFHSVVRRQLFPQDTKQYLGVLVVLGMVPSDNPLVRERIWQMADGDTRLYAMPYTQTHTFRQLSFPMAEEQACALAKDAQALSAEILRRCGSWHAPVPQMLRDTALDLITAYAVYDRDPLAGPLGRSRVTLMGDAAHTMSPFKGQGANQTLLDATGLAAALQSGKPLRDALLAYEKEMIARSRSQVLGSRAAALQLHKPAILAPAEEARSTYRLPRAGIDALTAAHVGAWSTQSTDDLDQLVLDVLRPMLPFERHAPRYAAQLEET